MIKTVIWSLPSILKIRIFVPLALLCTTKVTKSLKFRPHQSDHSRAQWILFYRSVVGLKVWKMIQEFLQEYAFFLLHILIFLNVLLGDMGQQQIAYGQL